MTGTNDWEDFYVSSAVHPCFWSASKLSVSAEWGPSAAWLLFAPPSGFHFPTGGLCLTLTGNFPSEDSLLSPCLLCVCVCVSFAKSLVIVSSSVLLNTSWLSTSFCIKQVCLILEFLNQMKFWHPLLHTYSTSHWHKHGDFPVFFIVFPYRRTGSSFPPPFSDISHTWTWLCKLCATVGEGKHFSYLGDEHKQWLGLTISTVPWQQCSSCPHWSHHCVVCTVFSLSGSNPR